MLTRVADVAPGRHICHQACLGQLMPLSHPPLHAPPPPSKAVPWASSAGGAAHNSGNPTTAAATHMRLQSEEQRLCQAVLSRMEPWLAASTGGHRGRVDVAVGGSSARFDPPGALVHGAGGLALPASNSVSAAAEAASAADDDDAAGAKHAVQHGAGNCSALAMVWPPCLEEATEQVSSYVPSLKRCKMRGGGGQRTQSYPLYMVLLLKAAEVWKCHQRAAGIALTHSTLPRHPPALRCWRWL